MSTAVATTPDIELTPELVRKAMEIMAKRTINIKYQQDPMLWYTERFGGNPSDIDWTLHGGYENHEWDGTENPFKLAFERLAKWQSVGIESATSTGKTYLLPRIIYWFLDVFPNSLVVTTAPKQQQLKAVLWSEMASCFHQFRKIRPNAEMFNLRVLPNGSKVRFGRTNDGTGVNDDQIKDMHQAIGVVSGVRADEDSATKMQGYHRKYMLFVIEECAGVPAPVLTAIKNTCTGDHNIIIAVGNPDSVTDSLHEFSELSHVQHIRISAFDHPNIIHKRSIIEGAVTQRSIDIRAGEYGEESNLFRSRVRGIAPKQGKDSLIKYDWVESCWRFHSDYVPIDHDPWSFNALGVDVANSEEGDKACLAWGQNNILKRLHEFQCPDANALAHNITKDTFELISHKYPNYRTSKLKDFKISGNRIGVDAVGVGVGTINEFRHMGYQVKGLQGPADDKCYLLDKEGKPLYRFPSLRAQMYYQAAQDLMKRLVVIDIMDKKIFKALAKELTIIEYHQTDGYIKIESKDDIKKKLGGKSPNMADAFVYWNWMRKDRYTQGGAKPMG